MENLLVEERSLPGKELTRKERATYLKLVLMPIGLLLVLNAMFQLLPYNRLTAASWPYFLGIGAALVCISAYATFRMGRTLGFNTGQWVISALLFLLLFWGSFIYLLVMASKSIKERD